MTSIFLALNTARSALLTNQLVIETIDHNVANASTPGFTQQRVDLVAAPPYQVPTVIGPGGIPGQIGAGVMAQAVSRSRDQLLDIQYRYQNQLKGQWDTLNNLYTQVQSVINEPSDTALSSQLSTFFAAWHTLADDPTNSGSRTTVQQTGVRLATTLNNLAAQLTQVQQYADGQISDAVTNINNYAAQLANLNSQIAAVSASGQQPNDLMDQRDLLLDKISEITPIIYQIHASGTVTVQLATQVPGSTALQVADPTVPPLVQGNTVTGLNVTAMGIPTYAVAGNPPYVNPATLTPPGVITSPIGGTLGAAIDMRDTIIGNSITAATNNTGLISQLDKVAQALVYNVNNIHYNGYDASGTTTNTPFFQVLPPATSLTPPYTTVTTVTATNITLAPAILNSPQTIATAGVQNASGDGTIAQQIADLRTTIGSALSPFPNITIQQGYDNTLNALGSRAQLAKSNHANEATVVSMLDAQRQSVSGVSIDEQLTYLLQYQHSYSAAARLVTTVDSMLDTIINRMGAH
jgi:flagellar hook-associated protein 1 FlgK